MKESDKVAFYLKKANLVSFWLYALSSKQGEAFKREFNDLQTFWNLWFL